MAINDDSSNSEDDNENNKSNNNKNGNNNVTFAAGSDPPPSAAQEEADDPEDDQPRPPKKSKSRNNPAPSSERIDPNVKRSITLHMIRHAESYNNQIYRDARSIFKNGTPDFDKEGYQSYLDNTRSPDPELSDTGNLQVDKLTDYLVAHLSSQASSPVQIITSPMKRAVLTIRPTMEKLMQQEMDIDEEDAMQSSIDSKINRATPKCQVKVVGFSHESGGCYDKGVAKEGMNPQEITQMLQKSVAQPKRDIDFVGFPQPDRGWFVESVKGETRVQANSRADKFLLWLTEYLDQQLLDVDSNDEDIFDAGVSLPEEADENHHCKFSPRLRRRRTAVIVGHGDFMTLILRRIITGYGHFTEIPGVAHRSAFVHFNTGITELEYFGKGRFIVMYSNQTPHLRLEEHASLRTGGTLKDGWASVVPSEEHISHLKVFTVQQCENHILEQSEALQSLYLSSSKWQPGLTKAGSKQPGLQKANSRNGKTNDNRTNNNRKIHFLVERGLQVVGFATYSESLEQIFDVAIRPSAQEEVAKKLGRSIKYHALKVKGVGKLRVEPNSSSDIPLFQHMGFYEQSSSKKSARRAIVMEMELNIGS